MQKVLLVEDSKEIFTMVQHSIGSFVTLDWASNLADAYEKLSPDLSLILLDIELPDGNGIEFCTHVQNKQPQTPVFFLTSHDNLSEKVLGFSAGAEDYISKPFELLELKARVEAKLKKLELLKAVSDQQNWVEIEIDKGRQEVSVLNGKDFEKVDLTALEFKLLTYFAEQPGIVISRDQILNDIWGDEIHVYSRSVDTHVSKLRKKLNSVAHIVQSVHGVGYKFCPTSTDSSPN